MDTTEEKGTSLLTTEGKKAVKVNQMVSVGHDLGLGI